LENYSRYLKLAKQLFVGGGWFSVFGFRFSLLGFGFRAP